VTDADLPRNGIFFDLLSQIGNASNGFSDINAPRLEQCHARRVVSTVFQAAQAIEKDRKGIRGSYVSNNSAHKSKKTKESLTMKGLYFK
jgi:hypothetical protein